MCINHQCPYVNYSSSKNNESYCEFKNEPVTSCAGCKSICNKCGHLNMTCIGDNVFPDGSCPSFFDPSVYDRMREEMGYDEDMDFGDPADYLDGPDVSLGTIERNYGCVQEYMRCKSEPSHGPIKRLEDHADQLKKKYRQIKGCFYMGCETMRCPHLLFHSDGYYAYHFCMHKEACPVGMDKIQNRHDKVFIPGPWDVHSEMSYWEDYKTKFFDNGVFEFYVEIRKECTDVHLIGGEIIQDDHANETYWTAQWCIRSTQPVVYIAFTRKTPVRRFGGIMSYTYEQDVEAFYLTEDTTGWVSGNQVDYNGKFIHSTRIIDREEGPIVATVPISFDRWIIR